MNKDLIITILSLALLTMTVLYVNKSQTVIIESPSHDNLAVGEEAIDKTTAENITQKVVEKEKFENPTIQESNNTETVKSEPVKTESVKTKTSQPQKMPYQNHQFILEVLNEFIEQNPKLYVDSLICEQARCQSQLRLAYGDRSFLRVSKLMRFLEVEKNLKTKLGDVKRINGGIRADMEISF